MKPQGVVSDDQPEAREGQAGRAGVAEKFVVTRKPGNAGVTKCGSALLKKLWAVGQSAAQIACRLGFSRNAVYAKLTRLSALEVDSRGNPISVDNNPDRTSAFGCEGPLLIFRASGVRCCPRDLKSGQ